MRLLMILALFVACIAPFSAVAEVAPVAARDLPPRLVIPDAARPGPGFDVDRATDAYIALLTPAQRAQSDAYFEGGYWLKLWGLMYGVGVAALLLGTRLSQRLRDIAERLLRRRWPQTWLYALQWVLVGFLLALPLSIYANFFREHQYALATQPFPEWFLEQLKGLAIAMVLLPPVIAMIYLAVRRTGSRWWIWASAGAFVFSLFASMLAPVFVEPLFNDYKPLRAGPARYAVLSLARANQVPTDHVVEFDASRQTTRISANVAGFLGTTRVALNDNLLDKTSLPEIKAVLGHEIGHYVLNHALRLTIYFTLLLAFGFWFTHCVFDAALARWGHRLALRGRDDPAALPLAVAILSLFFFLATPLTNSIVRQAEAEADVFGLNAAREPNGFAMVSMRLSTYRKIRPSAIEEAIFYDHPSGYMRVHGAMLWLRENQDNATANAPLAAPP